MRLKGMIGQRYPGIPGTPEDENPIERHIHICPGCGYETECCDEPHEPDEELTCVECAAEDGPDENTRGCDEFHARHDEGEI